MPIFNVFTSPVTRMSREQLGSLPTKQLQSYIKAYNLNAANLIEKSELIKLISGTELGETEERAFRSTAPSSPKADQGSSGEGRRREGSAPSRLERQRAEGDWNRERAQAREQQRRERERERRMREHEREERERDRERREWERERERWREVNGPRYPGQNAVEAVENMFEGIFGGGGNSGPSNGGERWSPSQPFGPGFPFVPPGTIPPFPGSEFIPSFVPPNPHTRPPPHPFNAPQHPPQNPMQRPTQPTSPQPSGSKATPPAEVPSLKALLQTNTDPSGLSAKTLKQILKNNKVEFGSVLEKSELVTRVKRLLDSEKAEMEKNGGDDEDALCKVGVVLL
ncbi:hypothetical protein SpCBS45565_g01410 [Spizellomyces sp. 'palustris']|nr:hypothetical protein SpCBS45565_g01410 [Spizellomyces sp. 'palustris']